MIITCFLFQWVYLLFFSFCRFLAKLFINMHLCDLLQLLRLFSQNVLNLNFIFSVYLESQPKGWFPQHFNFVLNSAICHFSIFRFECLQRFSTLIVFGSFFWYRRVFDRKFYCSILLVKSFTVFELLFILINKRYIWLRILLLLFYFIHFYFIQKN